MSQCQICAHAQRMEMDNSLTAAETFRSVVARFGVSRASLWRHWQKHIDPNQFKTGDKQFGRIGVSAQFSLVWAFILLYSVFDLRVQD